MMPFNAPLITPNLYLHTVGLYNIRRRHELIKDQSKTTWSYSCTWTDYSSVLVRVVKKPQRVNNDLHVLI